ncbi:MAG: hypothetical protein RLN75_08910 [Longimicrobiales bacterium]
MRPAPRALTVSSTLGSVLLACGGAGSAPGGAGGVRDTLPDGTPVVRYASLATTTEAATLTPDLRIGSLDGNGPDVFGDVRGIEADAHGDIYVLDYQAAEIRVFGPDGGYRRTLSRRGEGPGELGDANGIVLAGDTLFAYDHSKWVMMGLDRTGGDEVVRYPTPVRSYGYMWSGARDDRGRFWKSTSHSDAPPTFPPEEGLNEGTSRVYLKVYDPATERYDSLPVGQRTYRSWVTRVGTGYSMASIPFRASELTVVDPAGGFWTTASTAYRIARLDAGGDTTLVIEASVEPLPVTAADREAFVAPRAERGPEQERAARAMLDHAPETHPVLATLFVSPDGDLWVERTTAADAPTLYDVFTRDGDYRGSMRLDFTISAYLHPRVRGEHLYALSPGELDEAYVVRAPLPEWAAGG